MSRLYFKIKIDGLNDDTFVVTEFEGLETTSNYSFKQLQAFGFRYLIKLASRTQGISAIDVVDEFTTLSIYRDGELVNELTGIVRSFSANGTGHHHSFYSIELVPALERLSLRRNSRVFQSKSVPEIISELLDQAVVKDYAFAFTRRDYLQREYCVQFGETDLDFLQRIAADEGIFYYFEHENGIHTLVFADNSVLLPKLNEPVIYNNTSGGAPESPYISSLRVQTKSEVNEVLLSDRSFKQGTSLVESNSFANYIDYQRHDILHYDHPARFKDEETGKALSKVRLDYLRRESELAFCESNESKVRAGYRITVSDHADENVNQEWVVIAVVHKGTQPQALEESGGAGATTYKNSFMCIPKDRTWRPSPILKPQHPGMQTAIVVGPGEEEIYTDEYGRVRLKFFWDRDNDLNDEASCWIRVSSPWAGNQHGGVFIPRVGHEVIVGFLNGDIDQPVVTGSLYHSINKQPYPLPQNKTKTVLRTRSHGGRGFNELSFEDQAGKEMLYLHAQKDMKSDVLNDQLFNINNDQRTVVENDQITRVKNNKETVINGELRTLIEKDLTELIRGKARVTVDDVLSVLSKNEIKIEANKIVFNAASEIGFQVGQSFIKLTPSAIHASSPQMLFKNGGSPSKASDFTGTAPTLIDINSIAPAEPETIGPPIPLSTQKTAEMYGLVTMANCEKGTPHEIK